MTPVRIVAATIIALVLAFGSINFVSQAQAAPASTMGIDPSADKNNDGNPDCITVKEYDKLNLGMKISRVRAIIGSRGKSDAEYSDTVVRRWIACQASGNHYVPVCLGFKREEKADGTSSYRLRDKQERCEGNYPA